MKHLLKITFSTIFLFISTASLSGCANGYSQYYSGRTFSGNKNQCEIKGSFYHSELNQVISNMESQGFEFIGQSWFNSASTGSSSEALSACNDIGGDAVLVMIPEYAGSQTYAYQTTQYHNGQPYFQTSTTNVNGTANYNGTAFNSNGSYNYNGSIQGTGTATTTTVGMTPGYTTTQTNYITTNRYHYGALFFKRKGLGSDEDDESRMDYVDCLRSEGYVEPEDVCSGENSAKDGLFYWNPQKQACLKYDTSSSHVRSFCK